MTVYYILFLAFAAYCLVSPFLLAKAVMFGAKLANKPEKVEEWKIFDVPMPKKKPKMTAEEDRKAQILRNIDNYNGSSVGQVKVEVKHD
jgi:hypothetical protein